MGHKAEHLVTAVAEVKLPPWEVQAVVDEKKTKGQRSSPRTWWNGHRTQKRWARNSWGTGSRQTCCGEPLGKCRGLRIESRYQGTVLSRYFISGRAGARPFALGPECRWKVMGYDPKT